jgi:hypothetical protein
VGFRFTSELSVPVFDEAEGVEPNVYFLRKADPSFLWVCHSIRKAKEGAHPREGRRFNISSKASQLATIAAREIARGESLFPAPE